MSFSDSADDLFGNSPHSETTSKPAAKKNFNTVTLSPELTDIANCFSDMNLDTIKEHARKLGISFGNAKKSGVIAILANELSKNMKRYLDALEPVDRFVLTDLAHLGFTNVTTFQVLHQLPLPKYRFYCFSYSEDLNNNPLVHLLVHRCEDGLTMLEPLRKLICKVAPKPAKPPVTSSASYPETYNISIKDKVIPPRKVHFYEGGQKALAEARSVMRLVLSGKVKVTPANRRPTLASIVKVTEALVGEDFILDKGDEPSKSIWEKDIPPGPVRAHAWPVLLQQMKWARPRGGTLVLTSEGKAFVETGDSALWPEVFDNYMLNDDFDELNRIENIRGQTGRGKTRLSWLSERKESIALLLAELPVGEWIEFDEVYRQLVLLGLDFKVTDTRGLWGLYFDEPRHDALGFVYNQQGEQHPNLCRQYLRAALMESFATLGLIDIAYVAPHYIWPEFGYCSGLDDKMYLSRYDGLLAIRLNALGAYTLKLTSDYQPPPPGKATLQILPNLDVIVEAEQTPPEDRVMLNRFAQPVNERLWRLDRNLLLESFRQGMTLTEVLEYLAARSNRELPDTIRLTLDSWTSRAQAIKSASHAMLVEFRDSHDAMLLAHDTAARKLCHAAGSHCVVVPRGKYRAFQRAAQALGFVIPAMPEKKE